MTLQDIVKWHSKLEGTVLTAMGEVPSDGNDT